MVRRIGRYEITGELGRGGFGTVFRGYDRDMDRIVAIKVISSQGDASLINRFRLEAMACGNLNHKNIVIIYEFGEDNGTPFLAMEYLNGVDLKRIIEDEKKGAREPLTLLEKVEIMSEVAQGLQCAHEHGVVHRDVKPANIMRRNDGSVKIMDFGIARLTDTAGVTKTGMLIGTVEYMAPEQFEHGPVDALCDIWSYGVVFFELLTGIQPFRAPDAPPAVAMNRITREEPPPIDSLIPECPPELAASIRRLLSKDRHNRIQSLDDFVLDLEPVIASLRKIEIPELLKRAGRLIDEDNVDGTQLVIERLLKLDPSNKEARSLRDRAKIRPKISALLRDAEELAGSRDFPKAIEKINSAILLDPGSPILRSRLERIKGDGERARRAGEAITSGRRSLNEGDLTGAFTHFSRAVDCDPNNTQGVAFLEEARKAMRERERLAQIRAGMAEANNLIMIQAYDDAIALLADLSEKVGSDEQVVRRLEEARQLKRAQEIRDRLNADINASRELLKRGKYEQACATLEQLDRENPNNPAIEVLLTHARDRLSAERLSNQIETLLAQARGQRSNGRLEEGLEGVKRALELDPANAKALALQRIYLDEAQADRDRRKIDSELEQYQSLLKQEKLEEALALVARLAAEHPGEIRIAEAKVEAEEKIKKHKEERLKIQKGLLEAERLIAEAHPESATSLLEDLTIQYPTEAAVNDLLDRARRLKIAQEAQDLERIKAEKVSAQIERLLGEAQDQRASGRFEEALQFVQRALELDAANYKAIALNKTLLEEHQAQQSQRKLAAELEKLQALLKEQKLDQAQADVEQLVRSFPRDPRVAEAKRDIAKRIKERDEQRLREIRSGANEAERMLSEGRIGTAIQLLTRLTERFPDESSLSSLLERARQLEREKVLQEEIQRNLGSVNEFAARKAWDQALALIAKLLEQQPACREYLEEAENIQRLRQCDQELSAVEDALKSGPLELALAMAEAALAKFPGEPRAAAAIQTARNLRELNDLIIYARRRVANGDLEEARQLVKDGRVRFRDSAELREIESAIEKARGLEQSLRNARQALQKRRFDEARKLVNELLNADSGSAAARQLLQEIETRQKEYERQQSYDRGRKEAENLLRTLQFGSAIDKLQQMLLEFPGDAILREDMDRACTARDEHARREKYKRVRAESQEVSEQGNLVAAIAILENLSTEFPNDPAIVADLDAFRAAKLLREERIKIDALIAELDAMFRAGDAEGVRRGAKDILSRYKEPRASEHLNWAEKSIAQTREIRTKNGTHRPLVLWGGIGGLVLIAGAAIILWPPHRPPPPLPEFKVQPAEIVFSYQKGGPVPTSRPIHIETGSPTQSWRIAPSDSWLQFSSVAGAGSSNLDATVDPSRLFLGENRSTATVTSGPRQEILGVLVRVTESPVPPPPPPREIQIEPSEMMFAYQKKGPLPGAKRLQVSAASDQSWTIVHPEAWLLVSKRAGTGMTNIDIGVDPSKLDVGDHTSVVRINSASGTKTLTVSLKVTDPPLRLPDPVDCNAPGWTGSSPGTFFWKGALADKDTLVITDGRDSFGNRVTGRPLPGCEVSITLVPGLVISDPSPVNNFRIISVTNKSGHEINSIQITWTIKLPADLRR